MNYSKQINYGIQLFRYEDLKNDTYGEMRKMLDFLKFRYKPAVLIKNLAQEFNTFKRYQEGAET